MPRKKKVVEEPVVEEEPTSEEPVIEELEVTEVTPVVTTEVVVEPEPAKPTLEELLNNPPVLPYPEMQRLLPWINQLKEAAKR